MGQKIQHWLKEENRIHSLCNIIVFITIFVNQKLKGNVKEKENVIHIQEGKFSL